MQNPTLPFGHELFRSPYKEKIQKVLPTLFNMVELENRRGNRLGMEVGTARERVLIALLMYVYGYKSVEFPPSNSPELDVLCQQPTAINKDEVISGSHRKKKEAIIRDRWDLRTKLSTDVTCRVVEVRASCESPLRSTSSASGCKTV